MSLLNLLKNVFCLLGFKISTDVLNRNIDATIQTFYRKCNEVRFDFSMLSSDIKSKLISTYCMDLYGSQLWNYGTGCPETFYVAWRKVTRLIWKLPFRTHCNLLHNIVIIVILLNSYSKNGVLNFFTLVY